MNIKLPDLDTKTYAELVSEMMTLLPQYTQTWTNFNPSDPGITILELLCWVSESILYRTNRIPPDTYLTFTEWIVGEAGDSVKQAIDTIEENIQNRESPDLPLLALLQRVETWQKGPLPSPSEMQVQLLRFLQQPYLAVTSKDFETLTMDLAKAIIPVLQARSDSAETPYPSVIRVIPKSYVDYTQVNLVLSEERSYQTQNIIKRRKKKEIVSYTQLQTLINLSESEQKTRNEQSLDILKSMTEQLEPRQLLGSGCILALAKETPVNLVIDILCEPKADLEEVVLSASQIVRSYLQPTQNDWPYDQEPSTTDLQNQLQQSIEGIDSFQTFKMIYAATLQLNQLATLGRSSLLGGSPEQLTVLFFQGLPVLRYLEIRAVSASSTSAD